MYRYVLDNLFIEQAYIRGRALYYWEWTTDDHDPGLFAEAIATAT